MNPGKISLFTRILCVIGAAALAYSIFVPTWRIELDAPQYPEGLVLYIGPDKVGGDIEVINGLNHYIGMKTIHSEDFIEFKLLPYILGAFSLLVLSNAIIGRRKMLYLTLAAFVLFGVLAMVDFWRWNYNYGHDLDPNAAIKVPDMAYQPPLIGYKQLLNFGAFSVPDMGGIMLIICGGMLVIGSVWESGLMKRFRKSQHAAAAGIVLFSVQIVSCSGVEPEPIKINKDNCEFCKMTISDARFATELITDKGRIYKYDDLSCMKRYMKANSSVKHQSLWVADFSHPDQFVNAEEAFYVVSPDLHSPMNGNMAGFSSEEEAKKISAQYNTTVTNWNAVYSK